jgi:Flp pilus assembly pilin Flp
MLCGRRQFLRRGDSGQAVIEYALLAVLLSLVALAMIVLVGPELKSLLQTVVNGLATTSGSGHSCPPHNPHC